MFQIHPHTSSYLYDTVPRIHICINIDIIGYFREGWSVVICIHHPNIDNNWLTFLNTIKCCYLWGRKINLIEKSCKHKQYRIYSYNLKIFSYVIYSFKRMLKCLLIKGSSKTIIVPVIKVFYCARKQLWRILLDFYILNSSHTFNNLIYKMF